MREAIERVIAELESAQRYARSIGSIRGLAMATAYSVSVYKLKEVLAQNDTISTQTER